MVIDLERYGWHFVSVAGRGGRGGRARRDGEK